MIDRGENFCVTWGGGWRTVGSGRTGIHGVRPLTEWGAHMGVIALNRFATRPGRLADQLAAGAEAVGHMRRIGLQPMQLQPIAGGDIGSIVFAINHPDNAAYAAGTQKLQADEQWQAFWGGLMADPPADQVESTLMSDLDPTFQPDPDRPLGAMLATQWRPKDGRLNDFVGKVIESAPHVARMGGVTRALQIVVGAHPLTIMVVNGFSDLDAYGAYADRSATDAAWQAFWNDALNVPTADMIRSGVYVNITDG